MTVGLMLDEMFSPRITAELVRRGYDVIALADDPTRLGMPDDLVLEWATDQGHALLTENVRDFEMLRTAWLDEGRLCAGLLYTSHSRFPRDLRLIGRLVDALEVRLADGALPSAGEVDWLV